MTVKVGQRLHQQRMQQKLSLEDVAKATKIKPIYLGAIERGEYSKLPSPMYAQGFVRNYAAYLGLPKTETAALFRREFDEKKAFKVLPDSLTKTDEFPLHRLRIQRSVFTFAAIVLFFLAYVAYQYRSAYMPPALSLTSPKQDVLASQDITVSGHADANATVVVNNQPVSVNDNGEFAKTLTLFPGKSDIEVKAKNKFGKETVLHKTVIVK
jgi:cytoskeletal protein RodZ